METSTCNHENRHSDHFLSPVFGEVFHYQTHFASMIAFELLGAQDAELATQVLATDDFDIKQSLSKVALVRQWVPLCQNSDRMRAQGEGHGRGCCFPRTRTLRTNVAPPMVLADGVVVVQEWPDEAERWSGGPHPR